MPFIGKYKAIFFDHGIPHSDYLMDNSNNKSVVPSVSFTSISDYLYSHISTFLNISPKQLWGLCRQCTSDYKINTTDLNSHSGAHLMHYLIPGFFVNRPIRCNNRTFLPSFTWSLQRVKINTHKTSPKLQ